MNRVHQLILVAATVMGLLAFGVLLDGPSDIEHAAAVQTDLQDAIAQAGRDAPAVRMELARLEAESPEPTLRYALLGDAK